MAADDTNPKRIFMWFNPRSVSTAFEKCIGFMEGAQVWHEPYTACMYNRLATSEAELEEMPKMKETLISFAEVIAKLATDEHIYKGGNLSPAASFNFDWVKEQLEKPLEEGKTFMFMKECACAIDCYYDKLPEVPVRHTFLIRNPYRVALSTRQLMMDLFSYKGDADEFDFKDSNVYMAWSKASPNPLLRFFNHVRENIDPNPIIIDADDLQNHPADIMRQYCDAVGIPFNESNLTWPSSDEIMKTFHGSFEQLVHVKQLGPYRTAFNSSGFMPVTKKVPDTLPDNCACYLDEFEEGYNIMYKLRLKPSQST